MNKTTTRRRVRKHRAPKGALRLRSLLDHRRAVTGQKAPSAKRCIKTCGWKPSRSAHSLSESTERQKVH